MIACLTGLGVVLTGGGYDDRRHGEPRHRAEYERRDPLRWGGAFAGQGRSRKPRSSPQGCASPTY